MGYNLQSDALVSKLSDSPLYASIAHLVRRRAGALGAASLARDRVREDPVVRFADLLLWYFDRVRDTSIPMHNACLANAVRYLRLKATLTRVLALLNREGVPVVLLKGIALAEKLYDDAVLRRTGDIDLWVQPNDLQRAAGSLEDAGWALRRRADEAETWTLAASARLDDDWQMGEWVFHNQREPPYHVSLDLHIHLVPYVWYRVPYAIPEREIWDAARPLDLFPERAFELSDAHNLIYLCVHLAQHGMASLTWLLDVDQYVRRLAADPDWTWDPFLDCCRRWRVRSAVFHAFVFCRWLYGTPLPAGVVAALDPGPLARARVAWLLKPEHLVQDPPRSWGQRYPTLVKIALADRLVEIGRTFRMVVLPTAQWREHRYGSRVPLWRHWAHVVEVAARGD